MAVAGRIGERLAALSLAGAEAGRALRALLTAAGRAARGSAEDALRAALGPDADEPHALVCVRLPADGRTGDQELPGPRGIPSAAALARVPAPGGELVALLVRLRSARLPAAARTAAARLLEHFAVPDAVAGVSGGRTSLEELPGAWREAVGSARAAHAQPHLGPVAQWAALGPYRLLTALPAGAPPDPAVAPLLTPAHRELAHTAEVFLDHAGQAGRTATALAIHRQTLYYRLSRIEHLTGLDLSDGESRLLLHMALKAARL
jgi:hypothetical protein